MLKEKNFGEKIMNIILDSLRGSLRQSNGNWQVGICIYQGRGFIGSPSFNGK